MIDVIKALSRLSESEKEFLFKAPLLVCILIAGADGKVDNKEITEAIQMTRKKHWVKSVLTGFFQELSYDFEDKLKVVMQSYPFEVKKRNSEIATELSHVNSLWSKLEPEFRVAYYEMMKHLARGIASSSGKFWSKITQEEAKLIDLPMIDAPSEN